MRKTEGGGSLGGSLGARPGVVVNAALDLLTHVYESCGQLNNCEACSVREECVRKFDEVV